MKCNHPFETIMGGKCEICGKPVDEIIKQLQFKITILKKALTEIKNSKNVEYVETMIATEALNKIKEKP